jgi:hypothetical protein
MSQIQPGSAAISDDGVMRFTFASTRIGLAIEPGWYKGIEYIPPNMELKEGNLSTDLGGAPKLPADVYLRKIQPGWFLFYQRDE